MISLSYKIKTKPLNVVSTAFHGLDLVRFPQFYFAWHSVIFSVFQRHWTFSELLTNCDTSHHVDRIKLRTAVLQDLSTLCSSPWRAFQSLMGLIVNRYWNVKLSHCFAGPVYKSIVRKSYPEKLINWEDCSLYIILTISILAFFFHFLHSEMLSSGFCFKILGVLEGYSISFYCYLLG